MVEKRGQIHYRRRVPESLRGVVGKKEIWRSLGTDSPTVAKRRALRVAAEVEHEFEVARSRVGHIVDQIVLNGFSERAPIVEPVTEAEPLPSITFIDLYDAYMNDPTRDWSPTTRMAYQTTKRIVMAILGKDEALARIERLLARL